MRESKRILGYGHEDWSQFATDDSNGAISSDANSGHQSSHKPLEPKLPSPERILPFRHIWLSPSATITERINRNRRGHIYPLAMLGGVAHVLLLVCVLGAPQLSTFLLVPLMVVLACFLGLTWLYVFARLLKLTGRWFGGHAAAKDIEVPVGWSRSPEIVAIPVLAALFVFSMLHAKGTLAAWPPWLFPGLQWSFMAVAVVAVLWGLFILIAGVTAVQKFPVWKGVVSSLLAMLLGLALLSCVVLPVVLVSNVA